MERKSSNQALLRLILVLKTGTIILIRAGVVPNVGNEVTVAVSSMSPQYAVAKLQPELSIVKYVARNERNERTA
jgi:hypothetical protein